MSIRLFLAFLFLLLAGSTEAQKLKKADKAIMAVLQAHIRFLADDKLEGRRAGTAGEKLASDYISQQFQSIGISPKGTDGWLQAFEITA